jgi:predicted enzyme related to lactoylglutathione lyase
MSSSPFGLSRIGQISMRAIDLPRAVEFYRGTLGIRFLFEVPKMAFFDLSGLRLMLGEPEGAEHDHPGSILYFDVPDLEQVHLALANRGVRFDTVPSIVAKMPDHELWMAFFKDTEGNQLALMSEVRGR